MMPSEVTMDDAIAMLEEAVAYKGADYDYRAPRMSDLSFGCVMFFEQNGARVPSCVVGHVTAEMGILHIIEPGWGVTAMQGVLNAEGAWAESYDRSPALGVGGFDPAVAHILLTAQQKQDCGYTWGEALAAAYGTARSWGWEPRNLVPESVAPEEEMMLVS